MWKSTKFVVKSSIASVLLLGGICSAALDIPEFYRKYELAKYWPFVFKLFDSLKWLVEEHGLLFLLVLGTAIFGRYVLIDAEKARQKAKFEAVRKVAKMRSKKVKKK